MNSQNLDKFLANRTASALKKIEEEIYKEIKTAICEFFGVDSVCKLTEEQIEKIQEAQDARGKGFLKLGYNLVLKRLR